MGIFELHVDRIEVTNVLKFALFDRGERPENEGQSVSIEPRTDEKPSSPVSVGKILAVSVGATVLAVATARLKRIVDRKLGRHS